jgi:hypothetical protein
MVDLVLNADQIRSAPREVREWLKSVVEQELARGDTYEEQPRQAPSLALAECSPQEAALILEQIQNDYLASQVFFELGREDPLDRDRSSLLRRTSLEQIMHHVKFTDIEHLAVCLDEISDAFRTVRSDPNAALFAFDGEGGCYVHQTTRRSIRALWQTLVTARVGRHPAFLRSTMPTGPSVPIGSVPFDATKGQASAV